MARKVLTPLDMTSIPTGTAPLTITSTTVVTNLNADRLDGYHASDFALSGSDGRAFAMAANATTTTGGTALAANAQETATTVTFPSGRFSVTPAITANTSSPRYVVAITSTSSTGFTMVVRNVSDATGTAYTWNWMAVQMTSGSVSG